MTSRRSFNLSLAALGTGAALGAYAQASAPDYPSRPIRYIVPFPAGGLTDVMARLVGQKVAEVLRQPVIVDNKPGANANLGADLAAKSLPDGYTWLAITLTHAVNASLFPSLPYSLDKNLTPVAALASSPLVLVVHAGNPARNLPEFVAAAKQKRLNGGSSGNGTPPHMGMELLALGAKLEFTHVPYRGGPPSLNDLLGGQIDFVVSNLPECGAYIKAGKLRALAITSPLRSALLPEVPTFAELGMKEVELENWTGLVMPAGTPKSIVDRVAGEAIKVVELPEMRARMAVLGYAAMPKGPDAFARFLSEEVARWRTVVKTRNIHPE